MNQGPAGPQSRVVATRLLLHTTYTIVVIWLVTWVEEWINKCCQCNKYRQVESYTSSRINGIFHPHSPQLAPLNPSQPIEVWSNIFSLQCPNNLSKAWLNTFHLFQLPVHNHDIHALITNFVHVSRGFLLVWHHFLAMLIQYEFSRSIALVSRTPALVS